MDTKTRTFKDQLLSEIDAFLAKTGMNQTSLSLDATGYTDCIGRFRRGDGSMGLDKADKIRAFISNYIPPTHDGTRIDHLTGETVPREAAS